MLEEKAGYLKDFPINIRISHIENYPLHYHSDPEFIYVLKGFVTLKCGSSIYKMQKGDIFVVNESEVHGIYDCSTDNAVLMIQIETRYFIKMFPTLPYSVYRTLSKDRNDENLVYLRSQLLHIAFNYLKRSPGYKLEDTNLMAEILNFMDKYFASFYFEGKTVMQKKFEKPEQTERLGRIINYLYKYHEENITLKDLAEMEYLSEFYISHLITTGTGLNFRELLAFARVEESEKLLLQSNEKISAIAKKSGFSTTAYYIKFFKKWYMCEPEEYRKSYANHVKGFDIEKADELEPHEALKIITEEINFLSFEVSEAVGQKYHYDEISIDFKGEKVGSLQKKIKLGGKLETGHFNIYGSRPILNVMGVDAAENETLFFDESGNYVWDTVATIPHIAKKYVSDENDEIILNNYIDRKKGTSIVSGERGVFTSHEIAKPSYYAYRMLNTMKGDILGTDYYYIATRSDSDDESGMPRQFSILIYNTSEDIENLFNSKSNMRITEQTIARFADSRDVKISVSGLEAGMYQMVEISQNHKDSLFKMAFMDNGERYEMNDEEILLMDEAAMPETKVSSIYLKNDINLKINLKGLGYHLIRLTRK